MIQPPFPSTPLAAQKSQRHRAETTAFGGEGCCVCARVVCRCQAWKCTPPTHESGRLNFCTSTQLQGNFSFKNAAPSCRSRDEEPSTTACIILSLTDF